MPELENNLELLFDKLWPLCRSITGEGLRNSFKILQDVIPLNLTEVPTELKFLTGKYQKNGLSKMLTLLHQMEKRFVILKKTIYML